MSAVLVNIVTSMYVYSIWQRHRTAVALATDAFVTVAYSSCRPPAAATAAAAALPWRDDVTRAAAACG